MFSTKAIVFLTPLDFATKQDMILVSLFPVTAINASILLICSSSNKSTSLPSPFITKQFGNASAISKAFSLSFSTSFTLKLCLHKSLAVLVPILLPPRIITFFISTFTFPVNL